MGSVIRPLFAEPVTNGTARKMHYYGRKFSAIETSNITPIILRNCLIFPAYSLILHTTYHYSRKFVDSSITDESLNISTIVLRYTFDDAFLISQRKY